MLTIYNNVMPYNNKHESYKYYKKAGEIAFSIIKDVEKILKPGASVLDIVEWVEKEILKRGGSHAFPCNLSINEVAAHDTARIDDNRILKEGDVVKIDIGVHINGYIADTAKTIIVGAKNKKKDKLVKASKEALEEAISKIRPGIKSNEIGRVIEDTIRNYDLKPIVNLTGHFLERYKLHTNKVLFNIYTRHYFEIKENDVIAIEPFATDGYGKVVDEAEALIFRYLTRKPVRNIYARRLLDYIERNYPYLPFSERWLGKMMSKINLYAALRELINIKSIYAYNILREKARGLVSQAEHTVIVKRDGCEIITLA